MRLLVRLLIRSRSAIQPPAARNPRRWARFLSLLLVLFSSPVLRAQLDIDPTVERGMKPYGSFEGGGIDSVSTTNGNLNLHIPLVSYPQRGGQLKLGFYVKFDNNSYSYSTANQSACNQPPHVCGYGTFINGPLMEIVPDIGLTTYVSGAIPPSNGPYATIKTPDGSQHEMGAVSAGWRTIDATGYLCLNNCATVIDRNGIRYTQMSASGQPQKIEDPNGNFITAVAGSNGVLTSYVDTLNRTLPIPPNLGLGGAGFTSDFSGCTGSLPTVAAYPWTLPGVQGGQANFKICYANVYYGAETCRVLSGTTTCGVTLAHSPLIQSIVLPNDTAWTFQYDSANPNQSGSTGTGNLLQISFPTGGHIKYAWGSVYICQNPSTSTATIYTYAVGTRTVNSNDGTGDHTWTYSFVSVGEGASFTPFSTSSTDPLNQKTVHTISALGGLCSFYETKTQSYDSSGNLAKTVTTDYHSNVDPLWAGVPITSASNVIPIRATTTWPNGQVSKVETDPDPGVTLTGSSVVILYGNTVAKREYDYAPGAPGPLLRTTTTTYQALNNPSYLSNNLLSLPSTVVVTGTSGTAASTSYLYDQYALQTSGVSTQHDSVSPDGAAPGNVTTLQRWLNLPSVTNLNTKTTYYDTGNPYQVTDPRLNTTTYSYSSTFLGAYLTQVTNALGQSTTRGYDFNSGLVTSNTDPNNLQTTYSYDSMLRPTTVTYPPGGGQTTFCYTDEGGPTCTKAATPFQVVSTKQISANVNPLVSVEVFDGLGRPIQTQLTSDPDGVTYVDTLYDVLGRVFTKSNPHRSAASPTDGTTTYFYDALGRACLVVPPDGTLPTGTPCATQPSNDVFTTYSGNTTTVTDQAGNSRKSVSDGLGRLTQVIEASTYETDYSYDALDNLTCVAQKGTNTGTFTNCASTPVTWRPRSFAYDSLSRLISSINPESNTVTATGATLATTYSYDANGNLTSKIAPAQNQTGAATVTLSYCYDALNRLVSKAYTQQSCPMASPVATYAYDQGASGTNPIGRRTGMTDAAGSATWMYDAMGRPSLQKRTTNNITMTIAYTYNLDGSIASLTYPSGRTITYATGGAGRPLSAVDQDNSINYALGASYAPHGALSSLLLGQAGGFSGINLNQGYNPRLQPASIRGWSTNGVALDLSYCFYALANGVCPSSPTTNNGNVTRVVNNRDTTRTQNFTYDTLNRVATAYTDGNVWGETLQIDAWGNLNQISVLAGKPQAENLSQTAGTSNRFVGMSYDSAGNLLNDGASNYTYDAENKTTSGAGVTYTYDGDGNRVQKSSGKLYWYGMGGNVLDESDASGNITDEYVFFGSNRIARQHVVASCPSPNLVSNYYLADHLGTSRVVTDGSGNLLDDSDFYPFGGERQVISTSGNKYKFTGKERDSESGLDNFGARYYASTMGRFSSTDQKGLGLRHLLNPQKLNKYSYVLNNPLSLFDPNGMEEITITFRTFIPAKSFTYLGSNYGGDNRSFSTAPSASSRSSITVTVETDASKRPGNPIISQTSSAGPSERLDAKGNLTKEATATVGLPTATGTRDANGNPVINITQDTKNPLSPVPEFMTPSISANISATIPQDASSIKATGTISDFPAVEMNVTRADGNTTPILQLPPNPGATPSSLFLPDADVHVDKPTPQCQTADKGTKTCS
jgi:RHS repeat-associated protein